MSARASYALILAGGRGTRLWPLSNLDMPKQFLSLCGRSETLLQLTARRVMRASRAEGVRVVASPKWRELIESQLAGRGLADPFVIEEPEGRNTAPAIALGIAELIREGARPSDVVLVCPSDHLIADESAFVRAAEHAARAASDGSIAIFGIRPTYPETGFGYIKTRPDDAGSDVRAVEAFVEKPDAPTAARYLADGSYFWNGGYFCFRIDVMREALCRHLPESAGIFSPDAAASRAAFASCPKISIDHAVMEHASRISCVMLDAGWSDVGSWEAVHANSPRDADGNLLEGNVRVFGVRDSVVIGERGESRVICCIDLEDIVVIDTEGAVLVAPRASSQKLSDIVKRLREEGLAR